MLWSEILLHRDVCSILSFPKLLYHASVPNFLPFLLIFLLSFRFLIHAKHTFNVTVQIKCKQDMHLHKFSGRQDPQISKLGNIANLQMKSLGLLLFLLLLLQQAGVILLISRQLPLHSCWAKQNKGANLFFQDRTISYSSVSEKGNRDLDAELFINSVRYFE